jgi:hypothetical protein
LPVVQSATMGSTPGPPFPLVESRLRPPPARPGIVPRTALVDRLLESHATPSIAPDYCRRYRPAARMPQPVDSATSHLGFRCIVRA